MATETEKRKKSRGVMRAAFTRTLNECELSLHTENPDPQQVKICFEMLESKFEEMRILDAEVYELLLEDASENDMLKDVETADGYKRKFLEMRARYDQFGESESVHSRVGGNQPIDVRSNVNEAIVQGKRKFKLPKIEFKRFGGDIKDWLSFWAQFKKIHLDEDIDNHDKIEYLIQATAEGSRARQLVESYPAMGENYEKIVESMQSRFGREDLQIEVYVRELLKLILNNATSKEKMPLSSLYDRIETQLRALETLGITSEKCSAMLFPLIESCLTHDLLKAWQRYASNNLLQRSASSANLTKESNDNTLEIRLQNLMVFLRNEVENEQRISLAEEGFGLSLAKTSSSEDVKMKKNAKSHAIPTAANLINCETSKCVFCGGLHKSDTCFKARKLSFEEKKKILSEKNACFRCLNLHHQAKRCRARLHCIVCTKSHSILMCPQLTTNKHVDNKNSSSSTEIVVKDNALTNCTSPLVFLQTLRVSLKCADGLLEVRALIDTGSQRSYVLKDTAERLGYKAKRREKLIHCLFGGSENVNTHSCYELVISQGNYSYTFDALDQPFICRDLCHMSQGPWVQELKDMNIEISDTKGTGPIELLLGADIAGRLYTGRKRMLQCGLVAMETFVGWTLMGKVPCENPSPSLSMTTLSLLVKDASITELWELDTLGIREPLEKKSRSDMEAAAKELFTQTIKTNEDGRYEVRLPWVEDHPPLPSNYSLVQKRLNVAIKRLQNMHLMEEYDAVFKEWLAKDIIEQVHDDITNCGHYLSHRPVIKENSTTRIRPVFDASAREKNSPSLNNCLEKGENLIAAVPSILLRFRENQYGVIADICKAFLQIGINERDRDFLKFLWITPEGNEMVFKHKRVVFGINSSPFLLGATIEHHLKSCLGKCSKEQTPYSAETIFKLMKSFYVDNCAASVPDSATLRKFIDEAKLIMCEGKFDLRGWESNTDCGQDNETSVLGLIWQKSEDFLRINGNFWKDSNGAIEEFTITKRFILSMANRVFDVIGFTCPTTLLPKLLLQQLWEKQLPWDKRVDADIEKKFREWLNELPYLQQIRIPRWIGLGCDIEHASLHVFCDASKKAYSAVVFLRIVQQGKIKVSLLGAKARIAPLRKLTIPRLELLAAMIGVRLYSSIKGSLEVEVADSFFWSDSTTVLSWIKRKEEWSTFVWNRILEIRTTAKPDQWRHVPGNLNPADLPSRGCSAKYLLESKWWEGPEWLYQDLYFWPREELNFDEEEIAKERKKGLVKTLVNVHSDFWHLSYFSKYSKSVRMLGWVLRFIYNLRARKIGIERQTGELSATEFYNAERTLFKIVQSEGFIGTHDMRLKNLNPFVDQYGIIRLESRVSNRKDIESFRFPIVLPEKHCVVTALILEEHNNASHAGVQCLLSILREKYWILKGRRTVKSVIAKCTICKRHSSNAFQVEPPPLPLDRVRDAAIFEVTGVDLAGPLYLKTGEKVWICLFTCAVYRAVHFELVNSLSTHAFVQALRRFIARRGRPKTIYCDNGRNFVGAKNGLAQLDWDSMSQNSVVQRICWRFNPPSAPWWGGFWERLIRILKDLLRRVLGRASLNYEDLLTVICDCEMVINSRPLTYISNDPKDLEPLTPSMFLCERADHGISDCDVMDRQSLCKKLRHKQKLRDDLRRRFRVEYLGQLKLFYNRKPSRPVQVGEVVLIGNDADKRIDWPLGRVRELIPGKDNKVRLVCVKTARGHLLRPLQRLYPLECVEESLFARTPGAVTTNTDDLDLQSKAEGKEKAIGSAGVNQSRVPVITRSGRKSNLPERFHF